MPNIDVQKSSQQDQGGQSDIPPLYEGGGAFTQPGSFEHFFSLNPRGFFTNPFSAMRHISDEMDRVFGHFLGQGGAEIMAGFPAIEAAEHDGRLCVHADVPGLKPEDIKVEVAEGLLIIRGQPTQTDHVFF